MYALVRNGQIEAVRHPGRYETKLSDGRELSPPRDGWTDELAALCGFVTVMPTVRPVPPAGRTVDRTVDLIDGAPTVVWTERDMTQDELDAQAAVVNAGIIDQAITTALTRLDQLIAAPPLGAVPDGTMNTATLSNVVRALRDAAQANRAGAQEVALMLKRTIRLVRGDFDDID